MLTLQEVVLSAFFTYSNLRNKEERDELQKALCWRAALLFSGILSCIDISLD